MSSANVMLLATRLARRHMSSAHFNPAVTLAFAATRRFPLALVPVYLATQLVGAIAASVALRLLFGDVADLGTTLQAESNGQW